MSDVRALVVDYGGVLTAPIRDTFDGWLARDGIDPDSFAALIEEWRVDPDNPMHGLETGSVTSEEFAAYLVSRLRRTDGGTIPVEGLSERIFAGMHLVPDAFVMLRAARSAGLKTALLTNSWDFPYPWDELDPLLDVKVVSGEVGLRKPDPAIYALAAERLGVALEECAFVDDLEHNVTAADELGMVGVLFTDLPSTLAVLAERVPALAPYLTTHPTPGG